MWKCYRAGVEALAKYSLRVTWDLWDPFMPENVLACRYQYTVFQKKTRPFVISSYLCFDSYELHENFQKYIGGVAC